MRSLSPKCYVVPQVYQARVLARLNRGKVCKGCSFVLEEEVELVQATAPETISVDTSYKGPHIQIPITKAQFDSLILAFQRGEVR